MALTTLERDFLRLGATRMENSSVNGHGETSNATARHWTRLSRKVVLHRMVTAESLSDRLFWAIVLWSKCGVMSSDAVVRKDDKGYIQKDSNGEPLYATLNDLRELLGLAPGMKGHISRAAAYLEEVGSIRFGEKIPGSSRAQVIYPVEEPTLPEVPLKLPVLATWHIGTQVVSTGNLPTDEVARTKAIQWLDNAAKEWNSQLKALRTKHNQLLVQAISDGLIIIDKEKKSKREEQSAAAASPSVTMERPAPPPPPPQSAGNGTATVPAEETTVGPRLHEEHREVERALAKYGVADPDAARKLIARCRTYAPRCTPQEIARAIYLKGDRVKAGKIDNPTGYFIKTVPPLFEGPDYESRLTLSEPLSQISPEMRKFMQRTRETGAMTRAFLERQGKL